MTGIYEEGGRRCTEFAARPHVQHPDHAHEFRESPPAWQARGHGAELWCRACEVEGEPGICDVVVSVRA